MRRNKFRGTGRFAKPKNKFGAKKRELDGIIFDSTAESRRYEVLKDRQDKGEISELKLQPTYEIVINEKVVCKVKLDFEYLEHATGEYITEDVKGLDTAVSRLKRKLVLAAHGVDVRLIT